MRLPRALKKFKLERTCHVWSGPGWGCGRAREDHSGTFNFLPPSAKGLALSAYFQDGGNWVQGCQIGLALPLEHTAAGRAGRGGSQLSTSLLRSVGAQLVFTKRVGPKSPGSEASALRGAGPREATSKGWQNHCLLQGSEARPQLGGFWETRALQLGSKVVSGG